ncbi:type II toxin-antitoxin system VapB family antitoxin [Kitasatospora sp. NBC_00374]|uniref:type II toxin-antitoxin system VapB family antitoxin n=1 Tax=Kitasatospora sp. NBC_00374 TaxID=2975964 RepID=UPI0032472CF1
MSTIGIEADDEVLAEVMRRMGTASTSDAVNLALADYVQWRSRTAVPQTPPRGAARDGSGDPTLH